jgi:hypothetical protein
MIKLGNPKRIVMASATLGCALGIGYIMQSSATNRYVDQARAADVDAEAAEAFAQAFVGGTPVPAAKADAVPVPVEDKIGDVATSEAEGTPGPMADTGKKELFQEAAMAVEQSFDADGLRIESVTLTSAEPVPPATAPQPEALPGTQVHLAALEDAPIRSFPKEESAPVLNCEGDIEMTATAAAAGMVELDLTAPCQADVQFTLHHNGMMFSAITDGDGAWSMQVPALTRNAVFIAAFDNSEGAVANTVVDTLDYYDRYVLQWQGQSGMQIHAMEYGADYGEDGHVWRDAARDVASAATGEGGFLLRLGEGAIEEMTLMAEVYTFPTQNALHDGEVQVSLEAEINAANCGRDIDAQALIKPGDGEITARDLTMAIPDCDAVGDFLVLKNLYEDLKIARN